MHKLDSALEISNVLPTRFGKYGMQGTDSFFIYDNSFIVKWDMNKRPLESQCHYFLFGGRCGIVENPSDSDYVPDKMILSNSLE